MSFASVVYQLLIGPLSLIFEIVFSIVNRLLPNPGYTIIVLSLIVNILVLPLYNRAAAIQKNQSDIEAQLAPMITHIKKSFSGDERIMMLQTYYKQNHYSPIHVVKGSFSILLQVPFFLAAYNLLSGMKLLQGVAFGPIGDLGAPDQMLRVHQTSINLLPIIMTLINFLAGYIYLKGMPLKSKVQTYGTAIVFLILLYNSPSGLAFYWTLNNAFSMVKNLFSKFKHSKLILDISAFLIGLFITVFVFATHYFSLKVSSCLIILALGLMIPLALKVTSKKASTIHFEISTNKHDTKAFILGCAFMTLLTGALIPSALISDSPLEFVDIMNMHNPNIYILHSCVSAAGLFLVWFPLFFYLASPLIRRIMRHFCLACASVFAVNYFCFGSGLGQISSDFIFDDFPMYSTKVVILNGLCCCFVLVITIILSKFKTKALSAVFTAGCIAVFVMSAINMFSITNEYRKLYTSNNSEMPVISLTSSGQNVMVIMLDRAISSEVPYIFNEKPELREQFDGFVFYPNTISYGASTNVGSPEIFGGYDYTPMQMNARSDMLLADKHNEALLMMPVLFGENGYQVTFFNPPYANYQEISDLTIFDDYEYIKAFNAEDSMSIDGWMNKADNELMRNRNVFCYSLFKVVPNVLKGIIYNNGQYNSVVVNEGVDGGLDQVRYSLTTASGCSEDLLKRYYLLDSLSEITCIDSSDTNHLFLMDSNLTHSLCYLQAPDYVPQLNVDNTQYVLNYPDRNQLDGLEMHMDTQEQVASYDVNIAAYLCLGRYFDYLREIGCYDNTRIIIVSDHGYDIHQFDDMYIADWGLDLMSVNPVLFVKDFDSTGFSVDYSFMTNADVPFLATDGLISGAQNPFTGRSICGDSNDDRYVYFGDPHVQSNNGSVLSSGNWYYVSGDPHEPNNWEFCGNW